MFFTLIQIRMDIIQLSGKGRPVARGEESCGFLTCNPPAFSGVPPEPQYGGERHEGRGADTRASPLG
jgi:hypothetical protein